MFDVGTDVFDGTPHWDLKEMSKAYFIDHRSALFLYYNVQWLEIKYSTIDIVLIYVLSLCGGSKRY